MKEIQFKEWACLLEMGTYVNGGVAMRLVDAEDGGPVATATVWLDGLAPDEVAIKNYSENEGMMGALMGANVITAPHREIHSGFVDIPVCRLVVTP